jgi:hypothetical protein
MSVGVALGIAGVFIVGALARNLANRSRIRARMRARVKMDGELGRQPRAY